MSLGAAEGGRSQGGCSSRMEQSGGIKGRENGLQKEGEIRRLQ